MSLKISIITVCYNAEKTIYNSNNKINNKRYKYATGNCGASQCEFRFNGCSHLP